LPKTCQLDVNSLAQSKAKMGSTDMMMLSKYDIVRLLFGLFAY
jgi:hypothetical protein